MNATTILTPLLVLFIFLISSCGNKSGDDKTKTIDRYVIGKDTCNMTDGDGKRQGKWVPNYNNDLKDTVYYKDGEIVSK